jgi:hypothetical protein
VEINGQPASSAIFGGRARMELTFDVADGCIARIFIMTNRKLSNLRGLEAVT